MDTQRHVIDIDDAAPVPAKRPAPPAPLAAPLPPASMPAPMAPPAPYGAPPAYYAAAPATTMQQTVINVGSRKSVGGAVVLALLFGPLGMLYSTVPGAIVMFFVNVIIAIPTLGLGLLLTLPAGAIWAGVAASGNNNRIGTSVTQQLAHSAPPAGPSY
jgi:hypothetical protein